MNWLSGFNGPQTLGRGRGFWGAFVATVLLLAAAPFLVESFVVNNLAYFLLWTFMALGLSVIWGYAGILSFGQTAFFGLAGYGYGVISINLGDAHGLTWVAFAGALLLPTVFAAVVGYFMFYGGVRDVFVGIVTLSITLVMETFMAQTAGPEWAIGSARLNGFNGMSNMPPLTVPGVGENGLVLEGNALYWFVLGLAVLVYLGLRRLLNSRFGNVLVAIRENPDRAEMLGYDVRLYQLAAFTVGGTLAGISGVLYTTWGSYITPSAMGLTAAALPIVWTAAGGRKDITTTLVATVFLLWMSQTLAVQGAQYALVLMGAILLLVVLLAPDGLVLLATRGVERVVAALRRKGR
jgi:branched-chain amino acid transport system permease protein